MHRLFLAALFIKAGLAQCPDKFVDAGEVSVSAPRGSYQETTVTKELALPKGIRIDRSYLQKSIRSASDGAGTNMRADQIPPGIHLIPAGVGGAKWALDNPRLDLTGLKLSLELWVSRGQTTESDSGVRVRVCLRPQ